MKFIKEPINYWAYRSHNKIFEEKIRKGELMRHLPNIITILRIILSMMMIFIDPKSTMFLVIYCACGLSDIIDGLIARKFSLESELGAKLDSLADMIFLIVVFIKVLPLIGVPIFIISWLVVIGIIRMMSLFIVKIRFHTVGVLHTYLNKLTGFVLLMIPLFYRIVDIVIIGSFACFIASFAAVEELIIHLSAKEFMMDQKGILFGGIQRRD